MVFMLAAAMVLACNNGDKIPEKKNAEGIDKNKQQIKEQFIAANKQLIQKEKDEMDYYEKTHKLNFTQTNSGIRYFVYEHAARGDSIKDSSEVIIDYKLSLLDGTLCYTSEVDGKKRFLVGMEDIESGIHIGLKYLKRGDKALIMIPSHLAHGLLGDFKKIPPQMPIVYDVKVN